MDMDKLVSIRQALPEDRPAIEEIEAAAWPAGLAATAEQITARMAAFPEGQLVALRDGETVGVSWAQRIRGRLLATAPARYGALTDGGRFTNTHDPRGEIFQLVGVAAAPAARGLRLGRALINDEIRLARSLPGITRIVGFTRPARFLRSGSPRVEEYIARRDRRGRAVDPVLAFHLDGGARLVSVHPGFRPEDVDAGGYGVLIEYPLEEAPSATA